MLRSGEAGQPGGVPDAGRDLQPRPARRVPSKAPGMCSVGNVQFGGPEGQSGPER